MLRIVAIVLLLANGVYFAWTSGWLTGMGLPPAQQINPRGPRQQCPPNLFSGRVK